MTKSKQDAYLNGKLGYLCHMYIFTRKFSHYDWTFFPFNSISPPDSFCTDYTSPYTTISRYRRQHEQLQRLQRQRELEERRARLRRLTAASNGHPFFNRLPVSYFDPATTAAESNEAAADKQFPFFFGFGTMDDRDMDMLTRFIYCCFYLNIQC